MANLVDMPLFSTADKVPGFRGQTVYGVGRVSVGNFPIMCGLTGTKTVDGSMTPDSGIQQSFSLDQSVALVGARSSSLQQAIAAFSVPNCNVIHIPPAEASGAVAATITITFGGTWSTPGTVYFWVNGRPVQVSVGRADLVADVATTSVLSFGADQYLPVTAAALSAVTTLTVASKGTQGNSYTLGWDLSQAPTGLTVTVAGGTALHPKLVPFSGGTGTESVAAIMSLAESTVIDFWAAFQTDATNAGLIKAHVDYVCDPNIAHLEHAMFGAIGTLANATSLASSTLNDVRCAVVWYQNCETHPGVIAANAAAYRSSVVGANPNTVYADAALLTVAPQRYNEDAPNHATLMAALNSGVTPLYFKDGAVRIVRDCVSKCLTGSTPNYNTYGWPEADVPDRMRKEYGVEWAARRLSNPYDGPDVADGEASAGVGVETPRSLAAAFTVVAKNAEANNWIQDVDANPIYTEWSSTRKCIMWKAPCVVRGQNLQTGGQIMQTVAS